METSAINAFTTTEFTIKVANQPDVIEAFYITKVVMNDLLQNNSIHQDLFNNYYEKLKSYVDSNSLFILKNKNVSLGLLTFDEQEPAEFKNVSWENNGSPCLYISRIFVLPAWRNKGIGSALLSFAEEFARERGYGSIRLDASSTYEQGNLLLMKHNYRFAGNIFFHFQKAPVNCYEKAV
jgi:GNAT superfamily N-acetyltransferase